MLLFIFFSSWSSRENDLILSWFHSSDQTLCSIYSIYIPKVQNSFTNTVGICDIKNAHFHSSFLVLTQFTWKFATILNSLFPKIVCFLFFRFWYFWRENDLTKFPPNLAFSIIGYLMMVSERNHYKDAKIEKKIEIWPFTQKI